MSYKALYRTYRPQSFKEVAGQEHITKTLKNALKKNKFTHAYLFSGPRGTGKTSIAKIVAKTLNCIEYPTDEPCNECHICKGITDGSISDVIEIDAASNNGVDEIREIRDKVKYAPSVGRVKVYIIDEVHMLSTGAFNALLKTLEEPPKHVVFILATTEPHKIPATIISRCQRFDFKAISTKDSILKLKEVCHSEGIVISDEAIKVIAQNAKGGMRDALSILDQAISFSDGEVTINDVHTVTGTVSQQKLLELTTRISECNTVEAINVISDLLDSGKEVNRIIENLIFFYRDALLLKNGYNFELNDENEEVQLFLGNIDNNSIYEYISIFNNALNEMKYTSQPRIFLEVAIVKACNNINTKIKPQIKPVVKVQEPIKKEIIQEKVIEPVNKREEKIIEEPVKKHVVEENNTINVDEILNVLTKGNKDLRIMLQDEWESRLLTTLFDVDLMPYRDILLQGMPVACNQSTLIISFDEEMVASRVLDKRISDKLRVILKTAFELDCNIIPLPEEIWEEKRNEFAHKYKNKLPLVLSPITNFGPIKVKETQNVEPIVAEAISLFGEDLIEIEE